MARRLYIFLFVLFLPCWSTAANWPLVLEQQLAQARQSIRSIDIQAFKAVVDNPGDALIIDVREPNEYFEGHVPGAINIPRGMIEFRIWKHLGFPDSIDTGKTIYLYCQLGDRSALATHSLAQLGLTGVTAVNMRIADWEKAGYPLDW